MSYSKTTWKNGDKITSTLLNKMEQGIYDADGCEPFAVTGTMADGANSKITITLNKTAAEVYAAVVFGKFIKMTVDVAENHTVESAIPMMAIKESDDGTVTYKFRIVNEEGVGFSSAALAGTDALVMTEE